MTRTILRLRINQTSSIFVDQRTVNQLCPASRRRIRTGMMNQDTTVPIQAIVQRPMLNEKESSVPIPAIKISTIQYRAAKIKISSLPCWKKYAPPPKNQSPHRGIMHMVTQAISVRRKLVFFRQSCKAPSAFTDICSRRQDLQGTRYQIHPLSRARSFAPTPSVLCCLLWSSPSLRPLGRDLC